MKNVLFYIVIIAFLVSCKLEKKEIVQKDLKNELKYDSLLAEKFGADKYGMKTYVIAFLKRGPNRSKDSLEAAQLQKAHLENINRLAEEGKLVLAGPFYGDSELRGIYIFDVQSIEEAKRLTETDPSIQKGVLVMELYKWYGSAAVMAIPEIHKKLEESNFAE